jgi:hypothetical protein
VGRDARSSECASGGGAGAASLRRYLARLGECGTRSTVDWGKEDRVRGKEDGGHFFKQKAGGLLTGQRGHRAAHKITGRARPACVPRV